MTVRILMNQMRSGAIARDYLRLVKGARRRPTEETQESLQSGAQNILETIQQQNQPDDLDISIEGKTLIDQMDRDFQDVGLIPYWFTDAAKSRGEGIYPGVKVTIDGDASGKAYKTVEVYFGQEAVRITDATREFVLPWELVVPAEARETDARPYWFSAAARQRGEDLQIGDYVQIPGLDGKYELMDIFWQFGEVEIRLAGSEEFQGIPWKHIRPWRNDR